MVKVFLIIDRFFVDYPLDIGVIAYGRECFAILKKGARLFIYPKKG